MIKVITYGTFDLLHEGHINLLKRARELGDYLIVGVTSDDFDMSRGKINVQQSLMERIESVKNTKIADEVIPEEYVGQKIDDIKRNNVSIFAIGSDWEGKFDYLNEYCKVVYLPRTEGISSSLLRSQFVLKMGAVGEDPVIAKMKMLSSKVNGLDMCAIYSKSNDFSGFDLYCKSFDELLEKVDSVYIASTPQDRYGQIKKALQAGKHVISESPIALSRKEASELFKLSKENKAVLFDSIKTAYALPFSRLVLLIKSGVIGEIKSIELSCTSLENLAWLEKTSYYTSFTGWGAVGLLPIFNILGLDYKRIEINSISTEKIADAFTKVNVQYDNCLATVNVGVGVKSESDMVISGTKGYIYVPSPWWKSEYFEARFEDSSKNKPYYYQNGGEGLQMEFVHFLRCIKNNEENFYVDRRLTEKISEVMEIYLAKK